MEKCFEVAAQGKLQELQCLIEEDFQVLTTVDGLGKTLLHVAAECGQGEVVQYLNDVGSLSIDNKDKAGNTPLHLAVLNNHVGIADLLLSLGASAVSQNDTKILPLHLALQNKCSTEMIKVFAKYHDITDQVSRGFRDYTSLHVIAVNNNLKALKILYEAAVARRTEGAAINFLQMDLVDKDGLTPIHLAARKGSYKVLHFLFSKAVELNLKPREHFKCMIEKDSTPLHFAVEGNSLEIVQVLLKHGASPTATSGSLNPPIHLACSQNKQNIVKLMVEQSGQDILYCQNEQGHTPLHSCATLIGGKQLIAFLLTHGSQLNAQDTNGHTTLHLAVQFGNVATVKQLIADGSSPLVKDNCGYNCLHTAVKFKRKEVFKQLLQHPSITEMSDMLNHEGDLPIHLALREGLSDYVQHLLNYTHSEVADKNEDNYFHLAALAGDEKSIETLLTYPFAESMLNATNSEGKTPLHCSAISGNIACITLLLDHGAVVNKCHIGRTPFMYACSKGKLQSAKVLYEAHPMQRDWKDDEGNTALHLTACSGSADVTIYCLDIGMEITLNDKKNSFFDIIIESINSKLAMAVLKHSCWEACLDMSCPNKPHPVIRLIIQIPNAFQIILDNSITRSPLDPQHKLYWEKYKFKYVSLYAKPTDDRTNTNSESVNSNKKQVEDSSLSRESNHSPEVLLEMEALPKPGWTDKAPEDINLNFKQTNGTQIRRPPVRPLMKQERKKLLSDQQGMNNNQHSKPTMDVLNLLSERRTKICLTHPVVVQYLYLKWKDYASMLYIIKFLMVLLMTIFLSTFVGITPVPSQGGESIEASSDMNGTTTEPVFQDQISTAANAIRFVTIFFAALNTVIWIATIYVMTLKLLTDFVKEFEFWLYGCAILTTFIYLIPFRGLDSVIYEAGAIAVFTSWCVAFLQLEAVGVIGIYVSMFVSTTKNVLKVLLSCFFLFCAFGFSFYILVGSFSQLQFTNVGTSLVSSLSSALAIIDLNTFVALEFDGLLRFRVLTFILYVVMVITLPIVVINLLIGLAVGDIAKIQEEAEIDRQVLIITSLSKIDERLLPRSALVKLCRESYTSYPNRVGVLSSLFERVHKIYPVSQEMVNNLSVFSNENGNEEFEDEIEIAKSVKNLKYQTEQLAQMHLKQSETLTKLETMLQKLMAHEGLQYD